MLKQDMQPQPCNRSNKHWSKKHYKFFTYPHGVCLDSSQGKNEEKLQGTLATGITVDAIINSGPREADDNPIQIIVDAERMPLPRSGHAESSVARSCRRSSPESRQAQESRWTPTNCR